MELDREHDRPHPMQIEGWKAMGSARRTRLGIQLRRDMRRWKLAAFRSQHPDWTEERVRAELAKLYRGRT